MDSEPHSLSLGGDTLTRLLLCAAAAVLICSAVDTLSDCQSLSFFERYRPLLHDNRMEVIAVLTALLYALSLALFPKGDTEGEYTPCP